MHSHRFCCKTLLADPGLGFAICNIIYASQSNDLALAASFICALVILALRGLRMALPQASAPSPSRLMALLHDEALPLRLLGCIVIYSALFTLATLALGRVEGDMYHFVLLQAVSAFLFGVGNLLLAVSFNRATSAKRGIADSFRLPETWMAAGMLCLGLMAGWQAIVAFPFVAVGYWRALQNIRAGAPEYRGHPKLWYAAATLCFAAIAGNPWLVAANILNAACLAALEHRLTPQGLWRRRTQAFA